MYSQLYIWPNGVSHVSSFAPRRRQSSLTFQDDDSNGQLRMLIAHTKYASGQIDEHRKGMKTVVA